MPGQPSDSGFQGGQVCQKSGASRGGVDQTHLVLHFMIHAAIDSSRLCSCPEYAENFDGPRLLRFQN